MADEIKIDKGVPPPPRGRKSNYPFRSMEVGDSIFSEKVNRIRSAVGWVSSRYSMKFTVRTVTENGVKGVRVWRIE